MQSFSQDHFWQFLNQMSARSTTTRAYGNFPFAAAASNFFSQYMNVGQSLQGASIRSYEIWGGSCWSTNTLPLSPVCIESNVFPIFFGPWISMLKLSNSPPASTETVGSSPRSNLVLICRGFSPFEVVFVTVAIGLLLGWGVLRYLALVIHRCTGRFLVAI